MALTSDFHFLIQCRCRKLGRKTPYTNTNSHQKRIEINSETQDEANAEVVKTLNWEKNQKTLSQFESTAPVAQRLGGLQSQ